MSRIITCDICRFWVAAESLPANHAMMGDGFGECRRRSPHGGTFATYLTGGKEPKRVSTTAFPFPPTHAKDWCGEFEPPHPHQNPEDNG